MNNSPLTTDIEITEFLIEEIQNPKLMDVRILYSGICQILSYMRYNGLITQKQRQSFFLSYIYPKLIIKSEPFPYLFKQYLTKPRVEFLQNLLKDLKKT